MAAFKESKLDRLSDLAKYRIAGASGEWVHWHELRPAHRDRKTYEELMWLTILSDLDLETEEKPHGVRVRRRVRARTSA